MKYPEVKQKMLILLGNIKTDIENWTETIIMSLSQSVDMLSTLQFSSYHPRVLED